MNNKLYLVTFDGYNSWGADIYALGVYSTRQNAENAVEGLKKILRQRHDDITITELELDHTENVEVEDQGYGYGYLLRTDAYIGGYEE